MAKDSLYFSHDYNARNDGKLVRVMMKHGVAGIGLYWCIVEMMYEESGFIMRSECERIAFELRTEITVVQSILNDFDLFKNDEEKYWSESIKRRINEVLEKSKKASASANKRWDHLRNANALQSHCNRNAKKEKKEKEINKRKEKKEEDVLLNFPFESEEFKNGWKEWIDYKQTQFNFRYKSVQTEQTALNDLLKISLGREKSALEIIQNAIAKGWKGLYPVKDNINSAPVAQKKSESLNKIYQAAMGNGQG